MIADKHEPVCEPQRTETRRQRDLRRLVHDADIESAFRKDRSARERC